LATDNDCSKEPMATAHGDVETKAYFRKHLNAIKLLLSLAAQQATPVAIYPEGYCCSQATLLLFNQINNILTLCIKVHQRIQTMRLQGINACLELSSEIT
jgi:hypothetical protein